ncbi:hypothetical protein [Acidisphaera sp. S103]|uniref:hypothetical protein n=1 Tax=Acidisphaera sp. S103 TaxID=1747223 RepID=UPI00131D15FF|nr:hypothetical protein [Acidisphaera sp. S103]
MKRKFLAALTVLNLGAAVTPLANAQSFDQNWTVQHSGAYDNTANELNHNVTGDQ